MPERSRSELHADCPDVETLGEYVEGTLEDRRQEMEAHIATCEACYELASELLKNEEPTRPAIGLPTDTGQERWKELKRASRKIWRYAAAVLSLTAVASRC